MEAEELSNIISNKLVTNLQELTDQFHSNKKETPTRLFVLDDLLPENLTSDIYQNFPKYSEYVLQDTHREKKLEFNQSYLSKYPIVEKIADAFLMRNVVESISNITKINDLESDDSLYAGGITRMDRGHFLNPHIDNSHNSKKEKYRRLNLLFYITPNMREEYGGNLELWDKEIENPIKIVSKFNRLVVMETTKNSWHSVDPIVNDIKRCGIRIYYFSETSPEDYDYYHVTSFTGRPEQKLKRIYGKIDNLMRNSFVKITGFSRGKKSSRIKS
tara:strand:+ start:1054 stop:1872 length:819 start_codon:yes stop_codon:yes gene_type:complete